MRIVHLSDVHLGFRAYSKVSASGLNQREVDVVRTWRSTVSGILQDGGDLCVIAGDFFERAEVSNHVLTEAIEGLRAIADEMPIVLVGGNHDAPRSRRVGHPFRVLEAAVTGTRYSLIAVYDPTATMFEVSPGVAVAVVPHGAQGTVGRFLQSAENQARLDRAHTRILVLHAAIRDKEGKVLYAQMDDGSVPVDLLRPYRWDYIAAGDYHTRTQLAPNAWYAGSLEFVNAGPWQEAGESKGYLTYDTETKVATPQLVTPARPVFDLRVSVEPTDSGSDAVLNAIATVNDGAICRVVVENASRAQVSTFDWEALSRHLDRLLHLRVTFAAAAGDEGAPESEDPDTPFETLDERVRRFFETEWDSAAAGVPSEAARDAALRALAPEAADRPQGVAA